MSLNIFHPLQVSPFSLARVSVPWALGHQSQTQSLPHSIVHPSSTHCIFNFLYSLAFHFPHVIVWSLHEALARMQHWYFWTSAVGKLSKGYCRNEPLSQSLQKSIPQHKPWGHHNPGSQTIYKGYMLVCIPGNILYRILHEHPLVGLRWLTMSHTCIGK